MTTIPQTARAFKEWADRECGKWPMELTALAYSAWRTMERATFEGPLLFDTFTEKYRKWEAEQP